MKILRNILFFILFFLFGFLAGLQVASIVEAGKGQMLAGGAIVFGYGVIGAFIGIVTSIFLYISYKSKPKIISSLNVILTVLILCFSLLFYLKYQKKEAERKDQIGLLGVDSSINKIRLYHPIWSCLK